MAADKLRRTDKHAFCTNCFLPSAEELNKRILDRPDDVEDGGAEELVVDGRRHVARFVEGWGHGAHGVAQVHAPQQEEELGWGAQIFRWREN